MSKNEQDQGVRGRVIKHLRSLLLPVLGVGACTRQTPPVVCDPMPAPSDSLRNGDPPPNTDSANEGEPSALPNGSTQYAVPPPALSSTATPPVVCDPMPPPPSGKPKARVNPRPSPPVVCDPMPAPSKDR